MTELRELLFNIRDYYPDFEMAIINYAKRKPERLEAVLAFLRNNPDATSSEIIGFVSDQPDFYEDAAPMKAC